METPRDARTAPAPDRSRAIDLVIGGQIECSDVPALCERARDLLEGTDADVLVCDVSGLVDSDAATIDALARLALTVRRLGRDIRLRRPPPELQELLALAGLCQELRARPRSVVEVIGETEQRKQVLGIEEEVRADDPTI